MKQSSERQERGPLHEVILGKMKKEERGRWIRGPLLQKNENLTKAHNYRTLK